MGNKPRIAVILSGCGVFDGSEIHESVLTLLAIDQQGGEYACFAPDIAQHHVMDHRTGQETAEPRTVLTEAARIARGKIRDLAEYRAAEFSALVLPGGFGAAKNLSTFAMQGADCRVDPQVERAIKETHGAGKPIGALCIAPTILARVLEGVTVTIGSDARTAAAIGEMGGRHERTGHGEIVVDEQNRLVTTPCYMLDAAISQVAVGADNLVKAVIGLVG